MWEADVSMGLGPCLVVMPQTISHIAIDLNWCWKSFPNGRHNPLEASVDTQRAFPVAGFTIVSNFTHGQIVASNCLFDPRPSIVVYCCVLEFLDCDLFRPIYAQRNPKEDFWFAKALDLGTDMRYFGQLHPAFPWYAVYPLKNGGFLTWGYPPVIIPCSQDFPL